MTSPTPTGPGVVVCRQCGRKKKPKPDIFRHVESISDNTRVSPSLQPAVPEPCPSMSPSVEEFNGKPVATDAYHGVSRTRDDENCLVLTSGEDRRASAIDVQSKRLWCERCNSRLILLKLRAVRVWLPLARERLNCNQYTTGQRQEINQLLEYCIHDVLQLPLVTPDHVIDNAVTCDVCRTTRETLRLEAAHMIRSLEQILERAVSQADQTIALPTTWSSSLSELVSLASNPLGPSLSVVQCLPESTFSGQGRTVVPNALSLPPTRFGHSGYPLAPNEADSHRNVEEENQIQCGGDDVLVDVLCQTAICAAQSAMTWLKTSPLNTVASSEDTNPHFNHTKNPISGFQ